MKRLLCTLLAAGLLTGCTAGFGRTPSVDRDPITPGTPSTVDEVLAETPLPAYDAVYAADYHGGTVARRDGRPSYIQPIDADGRTTDARSLALTAPGAAELGWDDALRRGMVLLSAAGVGVPETDWTVVYYAAELTDLIGTRPFYRVLCGADASESGTYDALVQIDSTTGALQRLAVPGTMPGEQPMLTILCCGGRVEDDALGALDTLRAGAEPDDEAWAAFWASPAGALLLPEPDRTAALLTFDEAATAPYETAWQDYLESLRSWRDAGAPALAESLLTAGGLTVAGTGDVTADPLPETWREAAAYTSLHGQSLTAVCTLTGGDGTDWQVTVDLVRQAVSSAMPADESDPVLAREVHEYMVNCEDAGEIFTPIAPNLWADERIAGSDTLDSFRLSTALLRDYLRQLKTGQAVLYTIGDMLYLPDGSTVRLDTTDPTDLHAVAAEAVRDRLETLLRDRVRTAGSPAA